MELASTGTLITQLVDTVLIIERDGRIRSADDGLGQLLGYDPADAPGRAVWDFVHSEDIDKALGALERHLRQPGLREPMLMIRCLHIDGSWRLCEVPARTINSEDGAGIAIGLRWVGHIEPASGVDVAFDALSARAGFGSRYDCALVLNRDAVVTLVEDRVKSLLGYEPDAVIGRGVWEFLHPDDLEAAAESLGREMESPDNREPALVVRCKHANSTWRRCEAPAGNRFSDPALRGVVVALRYVGPVQRQATTGARARVAGALWATLTPVEQELVTGTPVTTTSATISGLASSTSYTVTVSSRNANGVTTSAGISFTTKAVPQSSGGGPTTTERPTPRPVCVPGRPCQRIP
jgi:PAS domain S-box-containing protein